MTIPSKIFARLAILSALLLALCGVWLVPGAQVVSAAPCCQSCPGFEDAGEEVTYCQNQCGVRSGPCYESCIDDVHFCYATCHYCSGGGGGGTCYTNSDCPYRPGYGFGTCVGGNCVY